MQYRLVDIGASFKKICTGKKWVGRVVKHATEPRYLGIINTTKGRIEVSMPTEAQAFAEVVARALGFASARDLLQHNQNVRSHNRELRNEASYAIDQALKSGGNYGPLFDLLGRIK